MPVVQSELKKSHFKVVTTVFIVKRNMAQHLLLEAEGQLNETCFYNRVIHIN